MSILNKIFAGLQVAEAAPPKKKVRRVKEGDGGQVIYNSDQYDANGNLIKLKPKEDNPDAVDEMLKD